MGDSENVDDNYEVQGDHEAQTTSVDEPQYDRYGFSGGKEYTNPDDDYRVPVKVLRARELKWREMCDHWEWWSKQNPLKLRERCRKGIPDSMRGQAWQRLCNSPMVLVARQKIIVRIDPTKARKPKRFFSSLHLNPNSKSLPNVITTSPSIRNKNGTDESRNVGHTALTGTGTGDTSPALSHNPSYPSLRSEKRSVPLLANVFEDDDIRPSHAGEDSQNRTYRWSQVVSPSDCAQSNYPTNSNNTNTNNITHSVGTGSYHSLVYTSANLQTRMIDQSTVPSYATISNMSIPVDAQHTCLPMSSYAMMGPTTTTDSEMPICSTVNNGSGGYASWSTNSGTDVTTTPNPAAGNLSNDSYSSSLHSSSAISSSYSMPYTPVGLGPMTMGAGQEDNPRDTLVPSELDPVALYDEYRMQDGTVANCEQIRRDIDRQFPFHELFSQKDGHGQSSLYTLLKAYTIRHVEKGYCQGQAPLAAVLLMFMPEVDAFWTFNEVCEHHLEAYYDEGLERIQIDGEILFALLKAVHPSIYKYLKKQNIQPILIVLEWFMCVYTRTLPWTTVLRVLDMFFYEGKVIIFRVAVVLLQRMFGTRSLRKACPNSDDALFRLRDVQSLVGNSEEFVREVVQVPIMPRDIAQEAARQSRRWEQTKMKNAVIV